MDFVSRQELTEQRILGGLHFLSLFWRIVEKYLGHLCTTELKWEVILAQTFFWAPAICQILCLGIVRGGRTSLLASGKDKQIILLLVRQAVTKGYWKSCRTMFFFFFNMWELFHNNQKQTVMGAWGPEGLAVFGELGTDTWAGFYFIFLIEATVNIASLCLFIYFKVN